METRAHNALIGLFTLAVVAAALGFVIWFARITDSQALKHFEIDFTGSISGLSVGSSVTFNGLRVGQVDTLDLNPRDPSRVIAIISVKDTTPVKVDTSARLEFTGITGGANIQLYGGKPNTADLQPMPDRKYAVIVAQRSELQNLVDGARDTISQAAQAITRVDSWLSENESSITATVHNIQIFTKALADNSGNVSDFLHTTGDAAKSISRLADNLNGMSGDLQSLIRAVSPEKIDHIVTNVSAASDQLTAFTKAFDASKAQAAVDNIATFSKTLADVREPLATFVTNASSLTTQLNAMAPKLDSTLDNVRQITAAVDTEKLGDVVENVKNFTAALGNSADQLTEFIKNARQVSGDLAAIAPKLGGAVDSFGKVASAIDPGKINGIIDDVRQITAAVDTGKIGEVVENVKNFTAALGNNADQLTDFIRNARQVSSDLTGITPKIGGAVDSFNKVASALDSSKINEIIGNLNRFSQTLGDSSPQVRQVVADATDISRKLNHAADQLDGIMNNVTTMTSSPNSQGMFAEITETAKAIRTLANNLDSRTALLAKNLTQFSGSGLRDYQQIAIDGQKTLLNVQRTLNSLQRNPQQLIFGPKSTIPDYKGK